MTNEGGNFDGKGESRVEIKAVHDGNWAYFLFVWEDPTRSLKHLPLIKEADGWHVLHHGLEAGDEYDFNEDKFSVLFTTAEVTHVSYTHLTLPTFSSVYISVVAVLFK